MSPAPREQVETRYAVTFGGASRPCLLCDGEEALSAPSRFSVRVSLERPDEVDLDAIVGRPAILTIVRATPDTRVPYERVIVLDVDDVAFGITTKNGTTVVVVDLVLEGPLARLRHRLDMRVFRDRTVPDIVTAVLAQHGITAARALETTYRVRPYTVQYRESDLAFVQRLLEDEGIAWRMEDGRLDDDPAQTDLRPRVTLTDGLGGWVDLPGERVSFAPRAGLARGDEHVFRIEERARLGPSRVVLRDFSVDRPSLDLVGASDVPNAPLAAERYAWGGGFDVPAVGAARARLRADALAGENLRIVGASDVARFAPGRAFRLDAAPPGFEDEHIALVQVRHAFSSVDGDDGAPARCSVEIGFEAIDAARVFRPEPRTPKPIILGFVEGEVCGPEGADIHTDPMGRVKVRFYWDRLQAKGPDVSDWIPVLQDNTSDSSAMPRIGWEVVCAFVDGDPDKPVVMGRLYNGADAFPTALPEGKTKSALRSLSSPGRDGSNAIWIDDKAGSELMSVHAERDQRIDVANDRTEKVLQNERSVVYGDETVAIAQNRTSTTTASHVGSVEGSLTVAVGGSHALKVGAGLQETVGKARSLQIGGAHLRKIGGLDKVAVTGALAETVGGLVLEASLKENTHTAGVASALTVGGAVIELTANDKSEQTQMLRVETVLGALKTSAKEAISVTAKTTRAVKAATLTVLSKVGDITFTSAAGLSVKAAGSVKLDAKEITLVVGGSSVSLTAEKIDVVSSGDVILQGDQAGLLLDGAVLNG